MILPLLTLLLQTFPADAKPVRVWLGSTGPLARGQSVTVYVQAARDGDLIVLHRRTDGRVEVLFPADPAADPFVRKGTYEIRGTGDRAAWVVAEPDGTGVILAALSFDPLRFDEFVRAAAWNPDALAPTWAGSDGVGVLSDVVQRMLGDGDFNYDFVTYTVAPPVYAQQQHDTAPGYGMYPVCLYCTFIGYEAIIIAPSHVGHRRLQRDEGICGIHEPCAEANQTHAMALALRPATRASVLPSQPRVVMPRRRSPSPSPSPGTSGDPITPRQRTPPARVVAAASVPLRHVRFTALSAPEAERPRATAERRGDGQVVAVHREATPVAHAGASARPIARSGLEARAGAQVPAAARQPAPRARSVAVAAAGGGAAAMQGMALPWSAGRGSASRGGANQFGVRRR